MSPEVSGDDEDDDEGGGCPVMQSVNQTNSIDGYVPDFFRTRIVFEGPVHLTLAKFQ